MKTFHSSFLPTVWFGFCQGIGVELSFFLLWVVYKVTHGKIGHKLGEEHWFKKLGEYFQ